MKLRQRVTLEPGLDPKDGMLKAVTKVIVEHHYLHRGRTMAQLPYWIHLDGQRCGVFLFALPRLSVAFHQHLPMHLLELARMWLDPRVQGESVEDSDGQTHSFPLASCAVGKALKQVRHDWATRYPTLPQPITAIVSWADMVHHEGTIYKAANFREVGYSGGRLHGNRQRSNGGRDQMNPDYVHPKRAFLYEYRDHLFVRGKRHS